MPEPATIAHDAPSGIAPVPSPFSCTWRRQGLQAGWAAVIGELDLATAPQLTTVLRRAQREASLTVLDLRGTEFIDTAGIHAIVDASIAARRAGRRLLVVPAPEDVHRVFDLAGVSDDLDLIDFPAVLQLARTT